MLLALLIYDNVTGLHLLFILLYNWGHSKMEITNFANSNLDFLPKAVTCHEMVQFIWSVNPHAGTLMINKDQIIDIDRHR